MLPTHPLGLLVSRINPNFQIQPVGEKVIRVGFSSGNVWLPPVTGFIPASAEIRSQMASLIWYDRNDVFRRGQTAADSLSFAADGVLREFRAQYLIPLPHHQQLEIGLRSYILGGGKPPLSLLTSDAFIEWFHTHIAGGEDPFARKVYGFGRAGFRFVDEKGTEYRMNSGDFSLPGLELDYHFFPKVESCLFGIHPNIGLHLGWNTSRYNVSIDPGISLAATRVFPWGNGHALKLSAGISTLWPGWRGSPSHVQFINVQALKTISWEINYRKNISETTSLGIGLYYYFQSPYRQRSEYESLVLFGSEISTHWHYALSHLYKSNENWSLYLNLARKRYSLSVYFREDFKVNNAPDLQTGIQVSFPVSSASKTI
ncbi:MAG: hypothetical protein R3D00_18270 [Bacteroidia bacterium]